MTKIVNHDINGLCLQCNEKYHFSVTLSLYNL